jgi:enterochelin esterase family protein
MKSEKLHAEYPISIFTPPEYSNNGPRCWVMATFDGGFPAMEPSLNNLLNAQKVPPIVVVALGNIRGDSRKRDLTASPLFADFVANEVVLSIRRNYNVYDDAQHTIIGGMSLGGYMAIYCGLHHSDVLGRVLALSPTLIASPGQDDPNPVWLKENPQIMSRQFVAAPLLPLKVYLSVGRYETFLPFSMVYEARRFRDVLEAKGYSVGYQEYDGGHMEVCWRGTFADGLIFLTSGALANKSGQ